MAAPPKQIEQDCYPDPAGQVKIGVGALWCSALPAGRRRLIVCCNECRHQVEPAPTEMATRYGAETSVLDWRARLVCSRCGSRQVDIVGTGTKR